MRAEDRALAAADPALPGLPLVLDDDALAGALREAVPDAGIRAARGTYVRYKPGTNCLVGLELETASGTHRGYARCEPPEDRPKLEKVVRTAKVPGSAGFAGVLLAPWSVAVLAFPNDRRLPALRKLAPPGEPLDVLAYKPERRVVARRGDSLLKAATPDASAAARAAAIALAGAGAPVQRLVEGDERRGVLRYAWIAGAPLDALLDGPDPSGVAGAAARALRALHACVPAGSLAPRTVAAEGRALAAAAKAAGVAGPQVARDARAVAAALGRVLEPVPSPRPVHGDFSADQVLMTPGGDGVLIDLDRAGLGDPREDLGSALADLELRVLEGRLAPEPAGRFAEALLAAAGARADDVRPWVAAGVLRRAAEPFRRRRPEWDRLVAEAVERAAELAALAGARSAERPPVAARDGRAAAADRPAPASAAPRPPRWPGCAPLRARPAAARRSSTPSPPSIRSRALPPARR